MKPPSKFGRRLAPHTITVARGDRLRSFSVPAWASWSAAGLAMSTVAWLIGSTAYIAFNDEIQDAARAHRISVERAYEDRIATLRRQIDEINTRQFLDQQAFETRLETLLSRQAALEKRQQDIAGLFSQARREKVTIRLDPSPGDTTRLASATGRSFDPSRPAPLDRARDKAAVASQTSEMETVDRIQASIRRVETVQSSLIGALDETLDATAEKLVAINDRVGARLPDGLAVEEGVGGPLVELRRGHSGLAEDRRLMRIRETLKRVRLLRDHVGALPVRQPLAGDLTITSRFGRRIDPFLGRPALHSGTDFRAPTGTPVLATAGGTVTIASYSGGYGRLIEIDHGNGYRTRYGHLSRILVAPGTSVTANQVIGRVGSSGRSSGPHLHYETRVHQRTIDPAPFIEISQTLPEFL